MSCEHNGIGQLLEDIDDVIAILISISALAEARPDIAESVGKAISTLLQGASIVAESVEYLLDEKEGP